MDDAKQTTIARWLAKAKNDLITARTMLDTDPPITDIVYFHAQQCAEKALKAFRGGYSCGENPLFAPPSGTVLPR